LRLAAKIRRNKKIHYLLKVLKHFNNEEYVDFFLKRETDPLLLEFKSLGDDFPEKKFYLIEEMGRGYGFFAEMRMLLGKLRFSEVFGLTPVINWGDNFLYHDRIDGQNAFETFFKQPSGYSVANLSNAYLVTKAKATQSSWVDQKSRKDDSLEKDSDMDISENDAEELGRVYREYLNLTEAISTNIDQEIGALIQGRKTLGVHFRGTDFKLNYNNHPICVTIEQEFEAIDQALEKNKYEQIFLATDETEAVACFRQRYGDRIIWYQDVFRGDSNTSVALSNSDRDNHKFRLAYEVIRDVYTLSHCMGLIGGVSQVTIFARIVKWSRKERYDYTNIINNGKNHNNKEFTIKNKQI